MRSTLLGLVTITGVLFAQTPEPEAALRQKYQAGEDAMRHGQWHDAEKAFLDIIAAAPKDPGAHANLGVVFMREQNWKRAIEELRIAEKLAPQVAGIRLNIGLAYYRQGEYHKAIAPFESVIRDQPDSAQARRLIAVCYLNDERYSDAVNALAPLWSSANSDLSYLYVMAIAAGNAKHHEFEGRAMTRLYEVGQDSPALHLLLGKAYLNRGEDAKALSELEQAAQADTRTPMVHYNLGIVYKRGREYEKAKAEFLQDVAIEPEVAYNYDELGNVSLALEQNRDARRYFEQALDRNPRIATSWYGLAKIDKAEKRYTQALRALDSAGALDPKSASVHYLRAQILALMGQREKSEAEFAEVRRLQKETTDNLEQQITGGKYHDPQIGVEQKF